MEETNLPILNPIQKTSTPTKKKKIKKEKVLVYAEGIGLFMINNKLSEIQWNLKAYLIFNMLSSENGTYKNRQINEPGKPTKYSVPISEIESFLGWESHKNREALEKDLRFLVETSLEYNVDGRDKNCKLDIEPLLTGVYIKNGLIEYSFGTKIENYIKTSQLFSKLILENVPKIKSKHAKPLYFLCKYELDRAARESCITKPISVENIKKITGGETHIKAFKYINQEYIKKPLKEINEKSELNVNPLYHKKGKNVVAVSLSVAYKEKLPLLELDFLNEERRAGEIPLITENPLKHKAKEELTLLGVWGEEIENLLEKHDAKMILETIEQTKETYKEKAGAGLIVRAIKRNGLKEKRGLTKHEILEKRMLLTELKLLIWSPTGVNPEIRKSTGFIGQSIFDFKRFEAENNTDALKKCRTYLEWQIKRLNELLGSLESKFELTLEEILAIEWNLNKPTFFSKLGTSENELAKMRASGTMAA